MSDSASIMVSASIPENCRVGQPNPCCENIIQDYFECAVDGFVWDPRPSVLTSDHLMCPTI